MNRFAVSISLALGLLPIITFAAQVTWPQAISSDQLGVSASLIQQARNEKISSTNLRGILIEIGNTTNRYTTIVIRVPQANNETSDETIEITPQTAILTAKGKVSKLDDWIAGDSLMISATKAQQSGYYRASSIKNLTLTNDSQTINGWIQVVDGVTNTLGVSWNDQYLSLNLTGAKLVVGNQNPALIYDFRAGDRIRARVKPSSTSAHQALIVVGLRRGDTFFMRTTRWIMPATITELPVDMSLPAKIEIRATPSRFYQENDINNIFGSPRKLVTVLVTSETKLNRSFLGQASFSEFAEGDQLELVGRWDDVNQVFTATTIRNISLQKNDAVYFYAQVTSVNLQQHAITAVTWKNSQQLKTLHLTFDDDSQFYQDRNPSFVKDLSLGSIVRIRAIANPIKLDNYFIQRLSVISIGGVPITAIPSFD